LSDLRTNLNEANGERRSIDAAKHDSIRRYLLSHLTKADGRFEYMVCSRLMGEVHATACKLLEVCELLNPVTRFKRKASQGRAAFRLGVGTGTLRSTHTGTY